MKVLFVNTVHPLLWEGLTKNGYECVEGYDLPKEKIQQIIHDFHGIIIRSRFKIDSNFLDACNNLKFIARSGSGLENIDVQYAEQKGIKCFNAAEGNAQAVAEHALGMLLSLFNKLNKADAEVRSGVWKREENRNHLSLIEDDSALCMLNSPYCRSTSMETASIKRLTDEYLKVPNSKS